MQTIPEDLKVLEEGVSSTTVGQNGMSLLDIAVCLARGKVTIGKFIAAAVVLSILVSLLIPNRYKATTLILPPKEAQSSASLVLGQLDAIAGLAGKGIGAKDPTAIYTAMLRSETVADAIIQRFNLQSVYRDKKLVDARKELAKRSFIDSTKDGLITVSVEDKSPARSAQMANAYVEELHELNSHLAITEAGQRRLFFEEQLRSAKDSLADAEVALKQTQMQTGLIEIDAQSSAIIRAISSLNAQIAATEVELQAKRIYATDQNPDIRLNEEKLEGLREQLGKLEARDPEHQASGNVQIPTTKVPEAALEYIRRLRDVRYYEVLFQIIAKQYEAARLDEAKSAPILQIVDPALVPEKKSSPNRTLIVALSAIAGLLVSCIYILMKETLIGDSGNPKIREQVSALKSELGFRPRPGSLFFRRGPQ